MARCFCESTHTLDDIDIALANGVDPIDRPPQLHAFFSDRAGWIAIGDELPRPSGPTGMEPLKPEEG